MRNSTCKVFLLTFLLVLLNLFFYPADGQWVLKRTSFNPPSGSYKFNNQYNTSHYSISTGSATCMKKVRKTTRDPSGNTIIVPEYSWNFSWTFDPPPQTIIPGKKYSLEIKGSGNGRKFFQNARPRGYISYKTRGGKLKAGSGSPGNASTGVVLNDRVQRKSQSFTFEVPLGTENNSYYGGKIIISAGFSNCYVTWEYVFSRGSVVEEEDKVPKISNIQVWQENISRSEAEIKVRATIRYAKNFAPGGRGDVFAYFKIGNNDSRVYDYQQQFTYNGKKVKVTGIIRTTVYGIETLRVDFVDKRFSNITNRRYLGYQDTLKIKLLVPRPSAEILGVNGLVTICRSNSLARRLGESFSRNQTRMQPVVYKEYEQINSSWLYEGDKVSLAGDPPSSISLEWAGGVRGQALYDNRFTRYTYGGAVFTIGPTRGMSGEVSKHWKRTWGESFQVLFTASANKVKDQVTGHYRDNAVDWILKKVPRIGSGLAKIRANLVAILFMNPGDTILSDVTYLDLKSIVNFKTGQNGRLVISTLSGNPDYYYHSGRSRVSVPEGTRLTSLSSGNVKRSSFNPLELNRWWDKIRYTRWDKRKEKGTVKGLYFPGLRSNVSDIRFYEGLGKVPQKDRKYKLIFPSPKTRYIWWELKMEHRNPQKKTDFQIKAVWKTLKGIVINKKTDRFFIPVNKESTHYSGGLGGRQFNNWKHGKYILELYINGRLAGSSLFSVSESLSGGVQIPSLGSRVKDIRFYEGVGNVPMKKREYRLIFPASQTRYIWWELHLDHYNNRERKNFTIQSVWRTLSGRELHRQNNQFYVPANQNATIYSGSFRVKNTTKWNPGRYIVDLYIGGKNIASGHVMVTGESKTTSR